MQNVFVVVEFYHVQDQTIKRTVLSVRIPLKADWLVGLIMGQMGMSVPRVGCSPSTVHEWGTNARILLVNGHRMGIRPHGRKRTVLSVRSPLKADWLVGLVAGAGGRVRAEGEVFAVHRPRMGHECTNCVRKRALHGDKSTVLSVQSPLKTDWLLGLIAGAGGRVRAAPCRVSSQAGRTVLCEGWGVRRPPSTNGARMCEYSRKRVSHGDKSIMLSVRSPLKADWLVGLVAGQVGVFVPRVRCSPSTVHEWGTNTRIILANGQSHGNKTART